MIYKIFVKLEIRRLTFRIGICGCLMFLFSTVITAASNKSQLFTSLGQKSRATIFYPGAMKLYIGIRLVKQLMLPSRVATISQL